METIDIGDLPVSASRIGLGTWAIGGWMWGGTSAREAVQTIQSAVDQGINLIDTAPVYGFGRAEELVGRALKADGRRARSIIATKVGVEWVNGEIYRNSSVQRIRQEVESSLRRLRTDYIDLYLVHWPDPSVPIEETAGALGRLLDEGKIRAIGVSNFSVEQMVSFRAVAPLHAIEPPYNLFERASERQIIPYARAQGMTILAYGALCRSLLTGSITAAATFQSDDLRSMDPKFQQPRLGQYLAAVAALQQLARDRYGKSVLALAIRWVLDSGPTIALWGARHPSQLLSVGDVLGWHLDTDTLQAIDRILLETIHDPVGPEFMAPTEEPAIHSDSTQSLRRSTSHASTAF
jgi:aryl-alcohol dehydrogenase-like predicted oxidoreductase